MRPLFSGLRAVRGLFEHGATFSAAGWQGRLAAVAVLVGCTWLLIALVAN